MPLQHRQPEAPPPLQAVMHLPEVEPRAPRQLPVLQPGLWQLVPLQERQ